jgi:hypothetical protein
MLCNAFVGTVVGFVAISCSVKAKGVHQLQVSISGVPVKGSPMTVIGKSDCELCVAKSEVFPLDGLVRSGVNDFHSYSLMSLL